MEKQPLNALAERSATTNMLTATIQNRLIPNWIHSIRQDVTRFGFTQMKRRSEHARRFCTEQKSG